MLAYLSQLLVLLPLVTFSSAAPLSRVTSLTNLNPNTTYTPPAKDLSTRQDTSPVPFSQAEIDATLLRPALFSRVSYCSTPAVTSWECGAPCEALGPVEVLLAGGDDGLIPMYFVSHDKTANTIVVAHQGTEKSSILSILNDVQIALVEMNPERFPSTVGTDILVHEGFQKTFERTADEMLGAVQAGLASTGATKVVATGHSLGGAVAMLDAVFLREQLPADIEVQTAVFGLPRGGNQAWADFVDATLGSTLSRVSNQNDPVPNLPPQFLDYQHSAGEIHIVSVDETGQVTEALNCPGQENENCAEGNSLFDTAIGDHGGPYFNNIEFGSSACPL